MGPLNPMNDNTPEKSPTESVIETSHKLRRVIDALYTKWPRLSNVKINPELYAECVNKNRTAVEIYGLLEMIHTSTGIQGSDVAFLSKVSAYINYVEDLLREDIATVSS